MLPTMPDIDLSAFLSELPLHAEEGPYREAISETTLLNALRGSLAVEKAVPAFFLLRRMLETLSLLDETELAQGRWAFVSFPASLLAHSLLETLSNPGQTLFAPDYWQQGRHQPGALIEEQRQLLHALEARRQRFHPAQQAHPIRFVHVAWGIIRLGNDFLLRHREDKSRPDVRNYVFPGGRLNLNDLPKKDRRAENLRHLAGKPAPEDALLNTLQRELAEELSLRYGIDYEAIPLRQLIPYCKLEGAQNNHALTEYRIAIYGIRLTPEGEAQLLEQISQADDLAWFTATDIIRAHGRPDGKSAFIDALKNEMQEALPDFLAAIPDSSALPALLSTESDAVDLPNFPHQSFRIGKTGKEKERKIPLNAEELALLLSLGALARGFDLHTQTEHLRALGGGWIKLQSQEAMDTARSLVGKLMQAKLPMLQIVAEHYARLTIAPTLIYFSESAFRYRLDGYTLHLALNLQLSPWMEEQEATKSLSIDATIKLALQTIQKNGRLWKGEVFLEGKDFDRELREKLDRHLRTFGLRKLVRMEREDYVIGVPCEE